MSDVFQEIDEEVRQDQLKALWNRWGMILIGSIVSIILAWTGWILWRDHVEATRAAESTAFAAAVLDTGGSGLDAFDQLAATADSGYAAIAGFHKAGVLLEQGYAMEAVDAYDAVAGDDATNERLRGLSSLMAAMVLADLELTDEARSRLRPLAIDGGDWALSAREIIALLDFRAGDLAAAESGFNALGSNAGTPASMRQRSQEMLDLIDSSRAFDSGPTTVPDIAEEKEDPS